MEKASRKQMALAGATIAMFIIAAIATLLTQGMGQQSHKPQAYIGNSSAGEDSPAATSSSIVNYDTLIGVGVTVNQIGALQAAFQKYKPTSIAGSTIDVNSDPSRFVAYAPDPHDRLYRPSISTSVLVDQKTSYRARIYYWGTGNVELILFDSTGATKLFDSGAVLGSN